MTINRTVREAESKLLKEIESMKFSFKKFLKVIELEAIIKYYAN